MPPSLGCHTIGINILILKTILFSQNMFQSIHTSSSVAKSKIKTVNILNVHIP